MLTKSMRLIVPALVLTGGLSCGGESPTGPDYPAPVASVSIAVTGDTLLYPGQATLLVASVRDSLGRFLTDRSVEWSSSDPAVATVDQAGWVHAVSPGTVTIAAVCEGKHAMASVGVRPVPVASVSVTINGDTVVQEGETRVLTAAARDSAGGILTGRAVVWFSSDTAVATVSQSGALRGVWEGRAVLTATVEGHWGAIAVRVVRIPVATVTVETGGLGAVYANGGRAAFTVTLRAANRDTLARSRRPVTWTSSDAAVATVDSSGVVVGAAAGPVTITASREGKTGTADLTVLDAPIADWAGVGEWVTFQADAARSGHVSATADPRAFHELWAVTVASGTPLSPAVASDGRAFVATDSYFGTQFLVAYDVSTGREAWAKSFGGIHGVHQPAVGNGRVYVTTSGHGDSYLYAFDAATGFQAFRSQYGNQWERYYAPVVTADAVFMAGGYYGGMYRFDAATGAQVWFASTNQYDLWTPAFRDTVVYSYTGSYSPKVSAVRAADGTVLYEIPDSSFSWNGWSMGTAPVLGGADDLLAVHDSRLISFDLATHSVRWERRDQYRGMVSVAGGVLYVVNGEGIEARAEVSGALLWSWQVPSGAGAPRDAVAVTDNLLFVSTDLMTFALDREAHTAVWKHPAGGRLSISGQGILFVAQANGTLRAVGLR